jgi:RNA polymerase-associated protein
MVSNALAAWGRRRPGGSLRTRTVLTLFSARDGLESHRARLILAAKGVSYELVLVDPGKAPDDLIDLNPFQTLPTLVDRDLVLYDVNVIGEYLDERYPHPPLMPVDPLSRARIRLGIARIQRDWYPFVETMHAGGKSQAETARKRLREQLLASIPVFKAAKFFLNPELSLADCALAPLVWRLPSLGLNLGREAQAIFDYGERIFRNPGYTRSMTDEEKLLRPA